MENDIREIKETLKNLATKEDLKGLATKQDLQNAFTGFWEGNLAPAFDQIHEGHSIMQTKLDKALYHEFDRLEKRLKVVEEKLGIKQV